jgi:hypothetical protein
LRRNRWNIDAALKATIAFQAVREQVRATDPAPAIYPNPLARFHSRAASQTCRSCREAGCKRRSRFFSCVQTTPGVSYGDAR